MLNKFSRSVTRHSPRTISKRSVSTLTENLETLNQGIKKAAKEKNPILKLRELRASDTYKEVSAMLNSARNTIRVSNQTHLDPAARTVAAAHTICHAFDAVIELSKIYDLEAMTVQSSSAGEEKVSAEVNDLAFREQITPEHETYLMSTFRTSWNKNDSLRQAAIFSVIHPEVAAEIGLKPDKTLTEISSRWGSIPPHKQLMKSELLALMDYVNSTTGIFNATNGAAMAEAYYQQKMMSDLIQVVSTALVGSINKLTEHPYFGKKNIETYKGINLSNDAAGLFRYAALKAAVRNETAISFPQVLSASSEELQSYARTKYDFGYVVECKIMMEKACYVDPFHDQNSRGEHEVIGEPGQKFVVTDRYSVITPTGETGGHNEIDRFVLEPKKKNQL